MVDDVLEVPQLQQRDYQSLTPMPASVSQAKQMGHFSQLTEQKGINIHRHSGETIPPTGIL